MAARFSVTLCSGQRPDDLVEVLGRDGQRALLHHLAGVLARRPRRRGRWRRRASSPPFLASRRTCERIGIVRLLLDDALRAAEGPGEFLGRRSSVPWDETPLSSLIPSVVAGGGSMWRTESSRAERRGFSGLENAPGSAPGPTLCSVAVDQRCQRPPTPLIPSPIRPRSTGDPTGSAVTGRASGVRVATAGLDLRVAGRAAPRRAPWPR